MIRLVEMIEFYGLMNKGRLFLLIVVLITKLSPSILPRYNCLPTIPYPKDSENPLLTEWGGTCGNSRYDRYPRNSTEEVRGYSRTVSMNNPNDMVPPKFRKATLRMTKPQVSGDIRERLRTDPVVIRINIVYEKSLQYQFSSPEELHKYVRNLIYQVQLVYEQPEMSSRIRFNFVVVSFGPLRLNVEPNLDTDKYLERFGIGPDYKDRRFADLNMIITYSNLRIENQVHKLLGLANVGIFCRENTYGALIANVFSLGQALTVAHELAHTLNVFHDGTEERIEGNCHHDMWIMSPSMGPKKHKWSSCSVEAMVDYFNSLEVRDCIYDPNRLATAVPFSGDFNFNSGSANRALLPGQSIPIDTQCSQTLDKSAISSLTSRKKNSPSALSTCQELVCILGGHLYINIGPAPSGSQCGIGDTPKTCYNGECSATG